MSDSNPQSYIDLKNILYFLCDRSCKKTKRKLYRIQGRIIKDDLMRLTTSNSYSNSIHSLWFYTPLKYTRFICNRYKFCLHFVDFVPKDEKLLQTYFVKILTKIFYNSLLSKMICFPKHFILIIFYPKRLSA